MARIEAIKPAGDWQGPAQDCVRLEYDERHRRRIVLTCLSGRRLLLDLPEARVLRHGDALLTDDGSLVEVEAAPERLLEISCQDEAELVRVAWHLGNRHLPTQFLGRTLRIREDRVIEDMLLGLGARVRAIEAPFDPEGGAYGHGAVPGHDGNRHDGQQSENHDHAEAHRHD